jgi:hypothetical protein
MVDGRDISGILRGIPVIDPRDTILVEHHGQATDMVDPDLQPWSAGNPATYAALRGATWLYVEYVTGEREYYNTAADPEQMNNIVASVPAGRLEQLHSTLLRMQACAGRAGCWNAQRM